MPFLFSLVLSCQQFFKLLHRIHHKGSSGLLQFAFCRITISDTNAVQVVCFRSLHIKIPVPDHHHLTGRYLAFWVQLPQCFLHYLFFLARLPSNSLPTTTSKYCTTSKCSRIFLTNTVGLLDATARRQPPSLSVFSRSAIPS